MLGVEVGAAQRRPPSDRTGGRGLAGGLEGEK